MITLQQTLRRTVFSARPRSLLLGPFFLAVGLWAIAASTAHADQAKAGRVLAIGGAVTEIVYALGEQDRLVGRDSTSTYPPEVSEKPDVGYMRALSPEGVLSVEPDLILARANAGPPEAIDVLRSAGVEWVEVPDEYTPEGVDETIRVVAEALGVPEKGERLRTALWDDLSAALAKASGVEDRKRVLFILSLRDERVLASGIGTAAHGIIELAGAENAVTDFEGYKQLSDEAVIVADPDVILMMEGRGVSEGHGAPNARITDHPALGMTTAAREGAIIRMDGLYILGFGPRTGQAAQELARAIYGDQLQ